jgi:hypothetical protein
MYLPVPTIAFLTKGLALAKTAVQMIAQKLLVMFSH